MSACANKGSNMELHCDKDRSPGLYRNVQPIKRRKPKALYVALSPDLHRKVKMLAASEGKYLKDWVTNLIEELPDP